MANSSLKKFTGSPKMYLHNNFIEGTYNLNVLAFKMLLAIAFKVQTKFYRGIESSLNEDFVLHDCDIEFSMKEIAEIIYVCPNAYHHFERILTELRCCKLKLQSIFEPNTKWYGGFLESFKVNEYGKFTIRLNRELLPYYFNLKEKFTPIYVKPIMSIGNFYTARIYLLLSQYQYISNYRVFTLKQFREMLGIETQYKEIGDLRKRILNTAINEIYTKHSALIILPTFINIYYFIHRNGKSYDKVVFLFDFEGLDRFNIPIKEKMTGGYLNQRYNIKSNIFKDEAIYIINGYKEIKLVDTNRNKA